MTAPLILYDDARARTFEPFASTRPLSELRAGAEIIRRRWERVAHRPATGFISAAHLERFAEFDAPRAASGTLPAGTLVVNARFVPALGDLSNDGGQWTNGGVLAAVQLASAVEAAQLATGEVTLEALATGHARGAPPSSGSSTIEGWWLNEVWDLVRLLPAMLDADVPALAATLHVMTDPPLTVLGEHAASIERGAFIEPFVLADTTAGPVLVCAGARVNAFTRLVGPCVIGPHAAVGGGRVSGCSIGEHARVHGEISSSIIVGHANKAHDGFVGHSVIGRWANLGAGTVTSNLKNSYGEVSLWTPDGVRPTGMQFLGALVGDHAKTGIGTRLTTGCVIGAGANVFGDRMPPKYVPPFSWGDAAPFAEYALDRFLEVAARVMRRRRVELTDDMRAALTVAWHRRNAFPA